jgi:hypothetical protein
VYPAVRAVSSMAMVSSAKYGFRTLATIRPRIRELMLRSSAARRLYTYPTAAIALRTRCLVDSGICGLSLSTRETVAVDTCARAATSLMVGRFMTPPR